MGGGVCCFKVGYQEGFLLGDSGVEACEMRGLSWFWWQLVTVEVWLGGGEGRAGWKDAVEGGQFEFYPKCSGKQAEGLEEERCGFSHFLWQGAGCSGARASVLLPAGPSLHKWFSNASLCLSG